MFRSLFVASVLFSAGLTGLVGGCSDTTAYADQIAAPQPNGPQIALGVSPAKIRAPYDVQIIRENGETLPTYAQKDRYYVQGSAGERYTIRIANPTARRIEAVVSVDGIDVIDGESGDLRKRGYVVPAYGETRIEGFRTSTADVATFRFSSVNDSYAGKKGAARNVGVIAVALFEEQASTEEQQIIVGEGDGRYRSPSSDKYDYTDDLDTAHGAPDPRQAPRYRPPSSDGAATRSGKDYKSDEGRVAAKKAPSYRPPADEAPAPTTATAQPSVRAPSPPPPPNGGYGGMRDRDRTAESEQSAEPARRNERPGLGTEFGESRYSAASYTRFVRAPGRPIAVAELRYNDVPGLEALGINVRPRPDSGEIMTRETADPFPGDSRFSRPPGE